MIQIWISLLLLALVTFFYKCIYQPKKLYNGYLKNLKGMGYKVYNVPFAPMQIPFFKLIKQDEKNGDALKVAKTIYKDNDVILANSLHRIVLDFSHYDFIKDFYSQDHLYTYPKQKFMTEPLTRAMGRGIPFSQGEQWKRKRRIINTVFNFDLIRSMTGKIEQLCSKSIEQVQKTAKHLTEDGQNKLQFDLINLTVRMFSSVVMECFLGGATDQMLDGKPLCLFMNQLIADVTQNSMQLLPIIFGAKFINAGLRARDRDCNRRIKLFKNWGRSFIHKKIEESKQRLKNEPDRKQPVDIIDALVRANAASADKHQDVYSQEQILEQFSTFFVAGTDSTSHYVMTMVYYIAQNPEVQKKLRQQIDQFMQNDDYSYENLKNLVYIDWIQKQTTRMYGPVTGLVIRTANKDNYLNGLPVKQGTYVTIQHMGNHYSQQYFKDPLVFRPERWESQCNQIPPFALGGFSAGARTCMGKHLVMVESKIGLIKIMKRYKKIQIPGPLRYVIKFLYTPEYFESKFTINE